MTSMPPMHRRARAELFRATVLSRAPVMTVCVAFCRLTFVRLRKCVLLTVIIVRCTNGDIVSRVILMWPRQQTAVTRELLSVSIIECLGSLGVLSRLGRPLKSLIVLWAKVLVLVVSGSITVVLMILVTRDMVRKSIRLLSVVIGLWVFWEWR